MSRPRSISEYIAATKAAELGRPADGDCQCCGSEFGTGLMKASRSTLPGICLECAQVMHAPTEFDMYPGDAP